MNYCDYYNIPFTTTINLVLAYTEKRKIEKKIAKIMITNLGVHGRYKNEVILYALSKLAGENNG